MVKGSRRVNMYRYYGGKLYKLRIQPQEKMHHDHVDFATIRYKHVAERIANHHRNKGELVRIVKVFNGWRLYIHSKKERE